jgi:methylmalonyl-CoA/ethylmalonyl-CoA epimerase
MPPPPLSGLNLGFHHLGLAVRRPQEAVAFLSALGYRAGESVLDPNQNVNLMMCAHETEPDVEIIWPSDTRGPLDAMLQRHSSGIIYHACYVTDDLSAALAAMEKAGLRAVCVSPPKPAPLFDGRMVSFYNIIGIGLVEILEP